MKKRLLNLMKLRTAMMLASVVVTFLGLPPKAWAQDQNPTWLQPGDTWSGYKLTVNSNPGDRAYYHIYDIDEVYISNDVTEIGYEAFRQCEYMEEFTFEDDSKLETIGESAFLSCKNLEEIIIPASVKTINDCAFDGCRELETVQFEAGSQLETIGSDAFYDCEVLRVINIPASVSSIGEWAFRNCTSLRSVTVSSSTPPALGDDAFSNTPSDILILVNYSSLAAYRQADGWSDYATKIKAIESTIPTTSGTCGKTSGDAVTWTMTDADNDGIYETLTIGGMGGDMAEYSSTSLAPWKDHSAYITRVVIEENVTNVSDESFADCTNLTDVNKVVDGVLMSKDGTIFVSYPADKTGDSYTLPATVTSIADGAFAGNSNLQALYVMQDTPPTLGSEVFPEGLTIYIPSGVYSAYTSDAKWNAYSTLMVPLSTVTTANGATATAVEAPFYTYNGVDYYTEGAVFELGHSTDAPEGYGAFIGYSFTSTTDITPNKDEGKDYFDLPANDVTVTALWKPLLSNTTEVTIGTIEDQTYTGNELKPAVTVTYKGEDLAESDCDITYSDNIDAGTATVTIKAKTESTVFDGETSKTFTIAPQGVTLTANSRNTDVFDGTEKKVTGFTCSVAGLTFEGVSASGSGAEVGTYDVTFTDVTVNETRDTSGNYVVTEIINGKLTINPTVGDLKVTNTMVSTVAADANIEYAFRVTLSNTSINGTFGDMNFTDGVANLFLKSGQSATATGLPTGIDYIVEKTDVEGYETTKEGDTGTISTTLSIAAFTNTREGGDLKVTNTVEPSDDTTEFEFTVTLNETSINHTFGDMTFENGVATFKLKGGQSATATGIPTSLDYTVTQMAAEGFETTKEGDEGTISSTLSTAAFVNTKTYTLTGLVFADGMHYATYCNTTDKDLTVPEGLKAYAVTGVNEDEDVVTLAEVGFLPKRDGTSFVALLMYRADLNTSVGTVYEYTGTETAPTTNLRYNLDEKGADDGDFVLYNDEFVKAKGTIPGGTRYLSMGGYAASRLGIGGEATGIFSNGLTRTDSDHDRWYDLQGRRIEKPTKPGLYIKNGQKQVIKTTN